MALSYGVTDYIEGGVITAVIILNVAIGFYQEFQAEKKMVRSLQPAIDPSGLTSHHRILYELYPHPRQLSFATGTSKPFPLPKSSPETSFRSKLVTPYPPIFA